jgi:hypothetical protein
MKCSTYASSPRSAASNKFFGCVVTGGGTGGTVDTRTGALAGPAARRAVGINPEINRTSEAIRPAKPGDGTCGTPERV